MHAGSQVSAVRSGRLPRKEARGIFAGHPREPGTPCPGARGREACAGLEVWHRGRFSKPTGLPGFSGLLVTR